MYWFCLMASSSAAVVHLKPNHSIARQSVALLGKDNDWIIVINYVISPVITLQHPVHRSAGEGCMWQSITAATVASSVPKADLPPVFSLISPSTALVYSCTGQTVGIVVPWRTAVYWWVVTLCCHMTPLPQMCVSSHDFITALALLFWDQPFH